MSDEKHVLPGGATRSNKAPDYFLLQRAGLVRLADRSTEGAKAHGPFNWLKSVYTERDAAAFCVEAYNHILDHLLKSAGGEEPEDDHLGAVLWGVHALCYIENLYGKRWTELDPNSDRAVGRKA